MRVPEVPYHPTIPVVLQEPRKDRVRRLMVIPMRVFLVKPGRPPATGGAATRRGHRKGNACGNPFGDRTRLGYRIPCRHADWGGGDAVQHDLQTSRAGDAHVRLGDVAVLLTASTLLGKDHEAFLEEAIDGLVASEPGRVFVPDLPYLRSVKLL